MLIASSLLVTPLLIVLGGLLGLAIGAFFIVVIRDPTPKEQRAREAAIAKDTARRTFDETIHRLFSEPPA